MSLTGDTLDISTIIVSGATNLIVCVVLTSLFCLLRPIKKDIYEPRSLYSEKKLKPLPNGIFSWLPRTLYANETEILNTVGLDSLMMIKFIGFGVKMLVLLTTCAIPLMVLHFFAKKIDKFVISLIV